MKVCVLQPDYSTTNVDYKNYDPPRNLSLLLPNDQVDHIFLNKLTVYKQLKDLSKNRYDIFINLCEGYLEWEVPSIDVIYYLELLNLPYTGPNAILYDPTKELMKYVAYTQGVKTPNYVLATKISDADTADSLLSFPMFIKPAKSGDSLGIDDFSLVNNKEELIYKSNEIINEYGEVLIEEYIDGREFTVLVVGKSNSNSSVLAYEPVEYIFPEGKNYKTYTLKTSELHLDANVIVKDEGIKKRLKESACSIFEGFEGVGYARLDFRMNEKGELFFLEINFTCSVFYADGYEGSADYILKLSGVGQKEFLIKIIEEGIKRYQAQQKKFTVKGNSISGYGIYASQIIKAGEIIFKGEGVTQRIITKSFVEKNWNVKEKENFRKYAYPISDEVFLLWDENPKNWAPQNHSCNANTSYNGLNVIATEEIKIGDELTLNYNDFLDISMDPFICKCGSNNCKGLITGIKGNTVSFRENKKNPS
jgi:D-alanine-D-alanine ligase